MVLMRAELINPFLGASFKVLKSLGNENIKKGELGLASSPVKGDEVNSTVGVTGDLLGQVIFCMSQQTASQVASTMLLGLPITTFDELAKSAICEFSNIVTGNAVTELGDKGLFCNLTPPTLFVGKDVLLSTKDLGFLVIPLETGFGDIKVYIALREADK